MPYRIARGPAGLDPQVAAIANCLRANAARLIRYTRPGSCVWPANGHATAAPPKRLMNARRLISAPYVEAIIAARSSSVEGVGVRIAQRQIDVRSGSRLRKNVS